MWVYFYQKMALEPIFGRFVVFFKKKKLLFYKSAKPCFLIFSVIFSIALLGKQRASWTAPACPHELISLQKWMKLKIGVDWKNKA